MKFNEQTIRLLGKCKPVKEGRLGYKKPSAEIYKDRICKLYQNMLFYYHINSMGHLTKSEPHGVIVLERCIVSLEPMADQCFVFKIAFEGGSAHLFSGSSMKVCQEWVDVLNVASFDHLRIQVEQLRIEIQKRTGFDPLDELIKKRMPENNNDNAVQSKSKLKQWVADKAGIVTKLTAVALSAATNSPITPQGQNTATAKVVKTTLSNAPVVNPPKKRQPPPIPVKPIIPKEALFQNTSATQMIQQVEQAKNITGWTTFDDSFVQQTEQISKLKPEQKDEAIPKHSQLISELELLWGQPNIQEAKVESKLSNDLDWLQPKSKESKVTDTKNSSNDLIQW